MKLFHVTRPQNYLIQYICIFLTNLLNRKLRKKFSKLPSTCSHQNCKGCERLDRGGCFCTALRWKYVTGCAAVARSFERCF